MPSLENQNKPKFKAFYKKKGLKKTVNLQKSVECPAEKYSDIQPLFN
jgi:hypothetical protein